MSADASKLAGPRMMASLFIYWDDTRSSVRRQLLNLQDVLKNRYGSSIEDLPLDHSASISSIEENLYYTIRDFVRKYDSPENLLFIIYSGECTIRGQDLFLQSRNDPEQGIQWSGDASSLDYNLLTASAPAYFIFDVRWRYNVSYLERFLDGMRAGIEIRQGMRPKERLGILISYECGELSLPPLAQAFETLSSSHAKGFNASMLHQFLNHENTQRYHSFVSGDAHGVTFFPQRWPTLELYQHVDFDDPLDRYFRLAETIHDEGICKIVRLSLDSSLQNFPLAKGKPCLVAVKRFTARSPHQRLRMKQSYLDERENLLEIANWNHERIMGMLASFEIRSSRSSTMNIVFEYASGGDLWNFLRLPPSLIDTRTGQSKGFPFSEFPGMLADWKYAIFREVMGLCEVLAFLHDKTRGTFIIHRDIKPSNILIHKNRLKLSDFGLSRLKGSEENSKTEWLLGSLMYGPPEKDSDIMGRGRDVWALGCVFLEIALMIACGPQDRETLEAKGTGPVDAFEMDRRAFSKAAGLSETAIYYRTMGCVNKMLDEFDNLVPDSLERAIVKEGMAPVIRSMLEINPSERITAEQATVKLREAYESLQKDSRFLDEFDGQSPRLPISEIPRQISTPMGIRFAVPRSNSSHSDIQLRLNEAGSLREDFSQSTLSDGTIEDSTEEDSFRFRKRKRLE